MNIGVGVCVGGASILKRRNSHERKNADADALKILRGNPGRRPLNAEEPWSPLLKRMPPAPGFLDDEGKRVWSSEGRRFIKAGLLTALDLTMFGTWCIWYSKRDLASRAVNQSGVVVRANGVGNPTSTHT